MDIHCGRRAGAAAAPLAVAVAAALFGTSATVAQLHAPALEPVSIAAWRLIVGGTALVVASWAAGCAPWRFAARPATVLLGSGTVVAFQAGYFAAVERLGVAQATVVTIAAGPIAAGVLDHCRGRASMTGRWAAGAGLTVAGVAVMSSGGWSTDATGWALAILAGCGFPVYGEVLRTLGADRPGLAAVATVFGGAVPLAAVGVLFTDLAAVPAVGDLGAVLYLGLVATAAAYLLWAYGLRTLPVRDTVLITMLEPVTAVLLAAAFLGEVITLSAVVGIAAVLAGIIWAATAVRGRDQEWATGALPG